MKELTAELVAALCKGDVNNAQVMLMSRQGLGFRKHLGAPPSKFPLSPTPTSKNKSKSRSQTQTRQQQQQQQQQQQSQPVMMGDYTCPGITLLDASFNVLREADALFSIFPSAWWVNLSSNGLSSINPDAWPLCLGSLDLSSNNLGLRDLFRLCGCHILRLNVTANPLMQDLPSLMKDAAAIPTLDAATATPEQLAERAMLVERRRRHGRLCLLANLPHVWVLDGDFCALRERRLTATAIPDDEASIRSYESFVPGMDATDPPTTAAQESADGRPGSPVEDLGMPRFSDDISVEGTDSGGNMTLTVRLPQRIDGSLDKRSDAFSIPSLARSDRGRPLVNWGTRHPSARESILMTAIQQLPMGDPTGDMSDAAKLDILLEDYLAEARAWNANAAASLDSKSPRQPSVDLLLLLYLPHAAKLDLSVLLTASIVFTLPRALLVDALVALLTPFSLLSVPEIEDLVTLPPFCRTALVSLLRRMARKEREELAALKVLLEKPARARYPLLPRASMTAAEERDLPLPPPATYLGQQPDAWVFLKPIHDFLSRSIASATKYGSSGSSSSAAFSDIEDEILRNLPDTPTMATKPINPATSYRDWLAFAARHAVLLLTRSQLCPSLTRGQANMTKQDTYKKLLPILSAASMTYRDLELQTTGPLHDGRVDVVEAGVLEFGAGLPKSGPNGLLWNQAGLQVVRGYETPWSDYLKTASSTSAARWASDTQTALEEDDVEDGNSGVKVLIQRTRRGATPKGLGPEMRGQEDLNGIVDGVGGSSLTTSTHDPNYNTEVFKSSRSQTLSEPRRVSSAPSKEGRRDVDFDSLHGAERALDQAEGSLSSPKHPMGAYSPPHTPSHRRSSASSRAATPIEFRFEGDGDGGASFPMRGSRLEEDVAVAVGGAHMSMLEFLESGERGGAGAALGSLEFSMSQSTVRSFDLSTNEDDVRTGSRGGSRGGSRRASGKGSSKVIMHGGMTNRRGSASLEELQPRVASQAEGNDPAVASVALHEEPPSAPILTKRIKKGSVMPSVHPTKLITGYAADAAWDAAFLLAPPGAILQHNRHEGRDEHWSSLSEAPVMLHPASMQMVPGIIDAADDGSVASVYSASEQSGPRDPVKETAAVAARRLLAEMGTLRNIRKMQAGAGAGASKGGRGKGSDLGAGGGAVASAWGPGSHVGSIAAGPANSWSLHTPVPEVLSPAAHTLHPSLGALLLSRGPAPSPGIHDNHESHLYLTALPDHDDPDAPTYSLTSTSSASSHTLPIQRGPSAAAAADEQHTADVRRALTTSISSAELLRMTCRYPRLYTQPAARAADVASSGKVLAAPWFPRYSKVVYTLDKKTVPMALLHMARANASYQSEGRSPSREKDHLAASLFQNSELSLAAPPGTRLTPLDLTHPHDPEAMTDRYESGPTSVRSDIDPLAPSTQNRAATMTDSLLGFTVTSEDGTKDSRDDGVGDPGEDSLPPITIVVPSLLPSPSPFSSPITSRRKRQEMARRRASGANAAQPFSVPVPSVQPGLDGGSSLEDRPEQGDEAGGGEVGGNVGPEGPDGAKELAEQSKDRFRYKVAGPVREPVYRVDAFEQRDVPLRARILSMPHPASARLHLNSSFRITRKPQPVPIVLPRREGDAKLMGDSVTRFDASGKPQFV